MAAQMAHAVVLSTAALQRHCGQTFATVEIFAALGHFEFNCSGACT
jgi:hypothetical protein